MWCKQQAFSVKGNTDEL